LEAERSFYFPPWFCGGEMGEPDESKHLQSSTKEKGEYFPEDEPWSSRGNGFGNELSGRWNYSGVRFEQEPKALP